MTLLDWIAFVVKLSIVFLGAALFSAALLNSIDLLNDVYLSSFKNHLAQISTIFISLPLDVYAICKENTCL